MSFKTKYINIGRGQQWPIDLLLLSLKDPELGGEEWWRRACILQSAAWQTKDSDLYEALDKAKEARWGSCFPVQEVTSPQNLPVSPSLQSQKEEELCHFVHPALDEEEQKKAHKEIKNLVAHHQLKDIIKYLKGMADEKRILLPQSADIAYKELVRLGMPDGEKGFSLKSFYREY